MKNPLDQAIQRWVTPVLSEAGFTRKGRMFFVEGADGSTGEIDVRRFSTGLHEVEFHVDFFVSPAVWAEFLFRANGTKHADMWRERLPGDVGSLPWDQAWSFDVGDEEAGARLQKAMAPLLAEQLRLLDQVELLKYCLQPRDESRGISVRRELAVPALMAAQGPSVALEERLASLGSDPARRESNERFVAFIRDWLAENYS